jgi:hypothetical protein
VNDKVPNPNAGARAAQQEREVVSVSREVKAGWEHRLPDLSGKWTHWRLTGDEKPIAEIPGSDLIGALKIVEANFGRFKSIKAVRAAQLPGGGFEEEHRDHEISRYDYDATDPG